MIYTPFQSPFRMHAIGQRSGHGGHRSHHGRHGGGMRGDGPSLRAARILSAADLHLVILALIEERPRHGYDLIKAIQELAAGSYTPSPGTIYPALSYLEELGQTTSVADGAKKQYRLTAVGLAALNESRPRVATLFDALKRVGERMEIAREAYDQSNGTPAQVARTAAAILDAARRDLKAILFDSLDAPAEEQQRIADILQRTIAEIRRR